MDARALVRELDRAGLLLLTDVRLPSVVSIVTGKPAAGSWWSHPRGKEIFAASEALAAHGDVVMVKLVLGKVTFVHRRLWHALWAVATARDPWQRNGLSRPAQALLERVDEEGQVSGGAKRAVDELEARLLVLARQVHTPEGRHERVLSSWPHWARAARFKPRKIPSLRARAELAAAISSTDRIWPWEDR